MSEKTTDPSDDPNGGGIVVEVDTANGDSSSQMTKLQADFDALDKEKKELWDRLVRTTADFDNLRKRTKREIDDAKIEARSRVLKDVLPVIDNLERAVQHADDSATAVVDGVKLVLRQFQQALERSEVTAIDAAGQPFDPALHEAISQNETDEHPPGTVVQVYQKGYRIGDRLLRPALVVVAKAKASDAHGANGKDPGAGSVDGEG